MMKKPQALRLAAEGVIKKILTEDEAFKCAAKIANL